MNHPVIGEIRPARDGRGWVTRLSLPAFQPCFERWDEDGREREDTRDPAEKAGRFSVHILPRSGDPGGAGGPSDAQAAAFADLRENQDQIARAMGEAMAREAPEVYHWDYLEGILSETMRETLATPAGIMQVIELQSLTIAARADGGYAMIGFAFHSEMLEPEHGVGVVMHRDRPVTVGTWDDLIELEYDGADPDEDDGE